MAPKTVLFFSADKLDLVLESMRGGRDKLSNHVLKELMSYLHIGISRIQLL